MLKSTKTPKSPRFASIITSLSTLSLLLTFAGNSSAAPKPTACATSITACGCTITTKGTYTVANDLDASQGLTKGGNCIEISADHVILDLVGSHIFGNNSGIGIKILPSGHDSTVQGTDLTEVGQAIIKKWKTGIEDDADNVVIELFRGIGGDSFDPVGNVGDGVLLQNVNNSTVANFKASFNGGTGVNIQGGSNNRIMNCDSISNAGSGVIVANSNVNAIINCTISGNTGYGIWLNSSNQNQLLTAAVNGNGKIGVLVGCHKEGKCLGSKGSNLNHFSSSGANGNSGAGITVEQGSSNNQITNMSSAGNGGTSDLIDNNPACDGNNWFNNAFGDASQTCIH
jgi:parallel beta-helix repeat protein